MGLEAAVSPDPSPGGRMVGGMTNTRSLESAIDRLHEHAHLYPNHFRGAEHLLKEGHKRGLPMPRIYPGLDEESISLEWDETAAWWVLSVSLEDEAQAYVHVCNLRDGRDADTHDATVSTDETFLDCLCALAKALETEP